MGDCPKPGSYIGWKEGDCRRYGVLVGIDAATGEYWIQRLHRPWRRVRRDPDDTTFLAGPADLADALDHLAVTFARSAP